MSSATHTIFVYGSSRRGQAKSCESSARYVGMASAQGYDLYELAALGRSYVLPASGDPTLPLSGELYQVDQDCLDELDCQHELSQGLYERVLIEVNTAEGSSVQAWIYEGLKIAPIKIESGDWGCRGVECGKA
jgi:gamma-glutamylcyclotransferase (GGCT)/AIG2-like uncharacterized protein YtfP